MLEQVLKAGILQCVRMLRKAVGSILFQGYRNNKDLKDFRHGDKMVM